LRDICSTARTDYCQERRREKTLGCGENEFRDNAHSLAGSPEPGPISPDLLTLNPASRPIRKPNGFPPLPMIFRSKDAVREDTGKVTERI
jgi:hypothetical protein